MRALAIIVLAGCNQILGGSITGADDTSPGDGGVTDGEHVLDGDHIVPDDAGGGSACAWTVPSMIAEYAKDVSIAGAPDGSAYLVYSIDYTLMMFSARAPGTAWSSPSAMQSRREGVVAVDATGSIHLVRKNAENELEYVVRPPAGAWSVPTARYLYQNETHGFAVGVGGPVVAYVEGTMQWGRPSTSSLTLAAIAMTRTSFWTRPEVAISNTGDVHLVAIAADFVGNLVGDSVHHLVLTAGAGSWRAENIDDGPIVGPGMTSAFGEHLALVVDSTQAAHLLYTKGSATRHLVYRRASPSLSAVFEPDAASIDSVVAVVDASDTLHVVTHDVVGDNLRYQLRTRSGAWTPAAEMTAAGTGGADVALAIDGTGTLHLVWTDPQKRLFYATRCTTP